MGRELPKTKYIAFGRGILDKTSDNIFVVFHPFETEYVSKEGYFVELLRDYKENDSYYLMYKIGSDANRHLRAFDKFYANYVPLNDKGQILTFEDISEKSRWQRDDKTFGSDLIGVLKADIDNLGLVFSKGFEIPRKVEEGIPELDRKTISRYLTLSRMIELFFSGWMREIMAADNKEAIIDELKGLEGIDKDRFVRYLKTDYVDFKNIYTVYSDGDDLVLVGPWETMIIFFAFSQSTIQKIYLPK